MTLIRWSSLLSGACLWLAALGAAAEYTRPPLDTTHSMVGFTASTLLFDVDGKFDSFDLRLDGSLDQPEQAKVEVTIDVASIDTDNAKRDEHLRSADFFDAAKHPKITFTSSQVTTTGKGLRVTGTLEMHGKKKQVTIPFKVARGKNGAGKQTVAYKGKLTLDRTAFGVGTDSIAAKISLDDEVEVSLFILVFP